MAMMPRHTVISRHADAAAIISPPDEYDFAISSFAHAAIELRDVFRRYADAAADIDADDADE